MTDDKIGKMLYAPNKHPSPKVLDESWQTQFYLIYLSRLEYGKEDSFLDGARERQYRVYNPSFLISAFVPEACPKEGSLRRRHDF